MAPNNKRFAVNRFMCGIAGIVGIDPLMLSFFQDESALRPILQHRGPDGFGMSTWESGSMLHWRLAVQDISPAGAQPMTCQSGRYTLVYNGEIYNKQYVRDKIHECCDSLGKSRPSWIGSSDTEVIVEALSALGLSALSLLNGMFAVAIRNNLTNEVWLARDRMGIKPLYVAIREKSIAYASEAKLLVACGAVKGTISRTGLMGYLTYGHSAESVRPFSGVIKLPPGELMQIRVGNGVISHHCERFCDPLTWRKRDLTLRKGAKQLRSVLTNAIVRQLVSDVGVGVLLSGGVDSSILAGVVAQEMGPKETVCFTLGYENGGADADETTSAADIARYYGVQHIIVRPSVEDVIHAIPRVVWHFDEPFADAAAINVYLICREIRKSVTVALAGEGSDELFGGYRRYQSERMLRRYPRSASIAQILTRRIRSVGGLRIPRRVQLLLDSIQQTNAVKRYTSYFRNDDQLLRRLQFADTVAPQDEQWMAAYAQSHQWPLIAGMCIDDQRCRLAESYLEKSDKASMAHSVEIRVPFLDNEVVEFANGLPDDLRVRGRVGKVVLKEAFRDLVPREVLNRFKRGFGIPLAPWFRGILGDYFASQVLAVGSRSREMFNLSSIDRLFTEHRIRGVDHSKVLWNILVLEVWLKQLAANVPSVHGDRIRFEDVVGETPLD